MDEYLTPEELEAAKRELERILKDDWVLIWDAMNWGGRRSISPAEVVVWICDPVDVPSKRLAGEFSAGDAARYEASMLEYAQKRGIRPVLVFGMELWRAGLEAEKVSIDLANEIRSRKLLPNQFWVVVNLDGFMLGKPVSFQRLTGGGTS